MGKVYKFIKKGQKMHTIKYKKCTAQQDNNTLTVTVSKENCKHITYAYATKLSGKELRTAVHKYLEEVNNA